MNIFFAYKTFTFIWNYGGELKIIKQVKLVASLLLVLNVLSVLLNIVGWVTLAKVLANAGIFGFIQIIGLWVFSDTIKSVSVLQTHTASVINNTTAIFTYYKHNRSLSRLLSVIVVML